MITPTEIDNETERKLTHLQKSFSIIIDTRLEVTNTLSSLNTVIDKLTNIYSELIKTNQEKIFVFGLDSFRFQCKLINAEYEDMKRIFLMMNNRMYCEYFKLYKIISEYISSNISDKDFLSARREESYPIYKDLEPFKNYDFELIQAVHESITTMLLSLHSYYLNRSRDLKNYKLKNDTGLNIDNFVFTFQHNIFAMKDKIALFIQYVEFFHKLHKKYLKRFSTKLHLMTSLINSDIKFEETTKEKHQNLLDEMQEYNEIFLEIRDDDTDTPVSNSLEEYTVSDATPESGENAEPDATTEPDAASAEPDENEECFKSPTFSAISVKEPAKKRAGRKKKGDL